MKFIQDGFKQVAFVVGMAIAANAYGQANDAEAAAARPQAQKTSKNAVSDPRKDEHDAIQQMAEAGLRDFILVSKKKAKLYIIQDSQVFLETSIIYGLGQGKKNRTPSGLFSLRNVFEGEAKKSMYFDVDSSGVYLIHGVVPGREPAFTKDNITARQLSDGCINVPDVILPYVLNFARQKGMNDPQKLSTPLLILDENYSAGKTAQAVSGFKRQAYNPNTVSYSY